MRSVAEQKRLERDSKRQAGWVLKQIWVRPSKWKLVQIAIKSITGEPK